MQAHCVSIYVYTWLYVLYTNISLVVNVIVILFYYIGTKNQIQESEIRDSPEYVLSNIC